jgi:phospholipid transport system transporter-binding protein
MLVLPSELTHRQASACLGMLRRALQVHREPSVVLDAHALTVFDSSALAVVLECRRQALSDGKRFSVVGLAPPLQAMAVLYGVQGLLAAPGDAQPSVEPKPELASHPASG